MNHILTLEILPICESNKSHESGDDNTLIFELTTEHKKRQYENEGLCEKFQMTHEEFTAYTYLDCPENSDDELLFLKM